MKYNVSVIIPTNASRVSIFSSIDSVRNQIYNDKVEIIVVVNGNNFNEEILSKLKRYKDIKLLNSPKPNGNAARHLGVESSDFEIICFLDDDDLWVPNKLSYQVSKMIEEKAKFSYTGRLVKSPYRNYYTISKPQRSNLYLEIFEKNFIGGFSSIAIFKDLYYEIGGVDQDLRCFQDYEFYLRCFDKTNTVSIIDKPVVIYSQHFGIKISNNFDINFKSSNYIITKYKKHQYFIILKKSIKKMLFRKGLKYLNPKLILFSFKL